MNTGLSDHDIELINSVFRKYAQIEKAYIFGSRAKGNFKTSSDIDLAIVANCDNLFYEKVAMELYELPLPYKFDVQNYDKIGNANLKSHIDRVGILIYTS